VFARLEETVREEMARGSVAGLAIALVKGDEVVFAEGYGTTSFAGGEPVTPDTRFAIMSVTKTLAATALMQLRDAGHFALDDAANQHLTPVKIANEFENESPVTIRQLATHTSGLPVGIALSVPGKPALAEFVASMARTTHRPGTKIVYANWGYDAIGVLIERLSGRTVEEYLRDAIFDPLGMNSTIYGNPSEGEARATGHYLSAVDGALHPLPLPDWPMTPASPAGGCWSNVFDLSRFLIAHLNDGVCGDAAILAPASVSEMHAVHAREATSDSGMGIGFRVTRANGQRLICHGGDGGGFTALIAAHPEERAGVAMLMNTGGMQAQRSVIGITALRELMGEPEPRTFTAAAPAPDGVYESTYWDIEVTARSGEEPSLTVTDGLVLSGHPAVSTLRPVAENTFAAEGGMFHGFELTTGTGSDGQPMLYGGLYPFTFEWKRDVAEESPVDESAPLAGAWRGTTKTPMGPLLVTLQITSDSAATIDTPFAQGLAIRKFNAAAGRVEGEFTMEVPGVGPTQMFLRLSAVDGALAGNIYARSAFGENAMRTRLERA
jgi:CubicO group peptidase (beta-lactamase class C family)